MLNLQNFTYRDDWDCSMRLTFNEQLDFGKDRSPKYVRYLTQSTQGGCLKTCFSLQEQKYGWIPDKDRNNYLCSRCYVTFSCNSPSQTATVNEGEIVMCISHPDRDYLFNRTGWPWWPILNSLILIQGYKSEDVQYSTIIFAAILV